MKNIKIAVIFLILLLLVYPAFCVTISGGNLINYKSGREYRGPVAPPVLNPQMDNLPPYMYKISSGLLNYIFPESRTAYYDEACSRVQMIKNRAIIPADQLGSQGQSIGDIAFVEVHIDSQYQSEAEPFFFSISSSQTWPGQFWIWGWVSLENVRELSKQGWVYSISMPGETGCLKMPDENTTQNQTNTPSSSNDLIPTIKNTTWIKQTGIKYQINTTPVKSTNNRFIFKKISQ